jgi:uridine kinase
VSCIIIGIAGGSCSGKTTFSRRAREKLGEDNCSILFQDNYYIDQSDKFDEDGGSVNFDHPDALDFPLMAKHLLELKKGNIVQVPIYDFSSHTRKKETLEFQAPKIVLVDGILILSQPAIVSVLDDSYFIECDTDTRFKRRLERDVSERGRSPEGVKNQFYKQVEPMHKEFVEASKEFAHHCLSQKTYLEKADLIIDEIAQRYL